LHDRQPDTAAADTANRLARLEPECAAPRRPGEDAAAHERGAVERQMESIFTTEFSLQQHALRVTGDPMNCRSGSPFCDSRGGAASGA